MSKRIPLKLKRYYQIKKLARDKAEEMRRVDRAKILNMRRRRDRQEMRMLKVKLSEIVGGSVLVNKDQLKELINIEHRLTPYKPVNRWLELTALTDEVWPLYGKKAVKRHDDVQIRALTINRAMQRGRFRRVAMLDGHGRMVHELLALNQNCKINLYELDEYTYEWHRMFLPNEVNNIKDNIIDKCYEQYLYEVQKFSNTLWYFNFCSIGNCYGFEKLLRLLEGIKQCKKDDPSFKSCVIITFSNRNYKPRLASGKPTQRRLLLDVMGHDYIRIDNGGLMHTYCDNEFLLE